ncbi:hypothetical protein DXG03_003999 [Asterophora parasitica]|uniref:Trafficking protein particle complex subunit 12 n=1 Tax=Asterophora parasitica TaxID=117018 RepID=A0A9P7K832_9AGAR|nr:hypothetical protein DXG03_003999 [Asterophora parasitica]
MSQPLDTDNKSSPARSLKRLPSKLGKKIKRQFRRLSSHVTPSKNVVDAFPIISVSNSPLVSPTSACQCHHRQSSSPPSSPHTTVSRTLYGESLKKGDSSNRSHWTSSRESLAYYAPSQSSKSSVDMEHPAHEETASTNARGGVVDDSAEGSRSTQPAAEESGQAVQPSPSELLLSNPPSAYVEPNVPDPFLIDDEESSGEEDTAQSQATIAPHELSLPLSNEPATPRSIGLASPNLNKAIPPPPSDSDTDDEESSDLDLPGLIIPTMFLPIPNTDPLSLLLTKYIYPPENRPARDVTGEWHRSDFHTLVMTNSWRALARMAQDRLVTADPEDVALILDLWYLRLASLARLRLFNQTSAECTNLFAALNAIEPPEARIRVFDRMLPFELEVMNARLKYWAGDHMGYLDALHALLRKCRTRARAEKDNATAASMWKERGARVCLIIASQLVEMKDYRAATKLLEPLCAQGDDSTAELRSSIGRIYLQSGNLEAASKHFELAAMDSAASQELKDMNTGLLASAEGDWVRASNLLQGLISKDANNLVAVNNLSVALLSQGKLREGTEVLEAALQASPSSVVVAEPFLFNLSTLYELRSLTAAENKRNLLVEVAKWSGDGLRTTCLKMPTN